MKPGAVSGDTWFPVPLDRCQQVVDAVRIVLVEARTHWLEVPKNKKKAEALAQRAEDQAAARARNAVWQPGDAPLEKRKSRPPQAVHVPGPLPVHKRRK